MYNFFNVFLFLCLFYKFFNLCIFLYIIFVSCFSLLAAEPLDGYALDPYSPSGRRDLFGSEKKALYEDFKQRNQSALELMLKGVNRNPVQALEFYDEAYDLASDVNLKIDILLYQASALCGLRRNIDALEKMYTAYQMASVDKKTIIRGLFDKKRSFIGAEIQTKYLLKGMRIPEEIKTQMDILSNVLLPMRILYRPQS